MTIEVHRLVYPTSAGRAISDEREKGYAFIPEERVEASVGTAFVRADKIRFDDRAQSGRTCMKWCNLGAACMCS